MTEIPIEPIKKIIINAGTSNATDEACVELIECLEDFAKQITVNANKLAKHAGRETVNTDDIKLAIELS